MKRMKRILITGASRGIGLELCRQLLSTKNQVLATYRSENTAQQLFEISRKAKNLELFKMDVDSSQSVSQNIKEIQSKYDSLDQVFNNAGIIDWNSWDLVSSESFRSIYETNVIGAFRVIKHTVPLLKEGNEPIIVNISSRLGSIELRGRSQLGGAIAYQCSKSALNMLTKQTSIDLSKFNIRVVSVSPGWVKTDMGGSDAKYEVEESARLVLSQVNQLSSFATGVFIGEDGENIPW